MVASPKFHIQKLLLQGSRLFVPASFESWKRPLKVGYTSVRNEERVFVYHNLEGLWKDVGSWQIIYEHFDFLLAWDFSMFECIRMFTWIICLIIISNHNQKTQKHYNRTMVSHWDNGPSFSPLRYRGRIWNPHRSNVPRDLSTKFQQKPPSMEISGPWVEWSPVGDGFLVNSGGLDFLTPKVSPCVTRSFWTFFFVREIFCRIKEIKEKHQKHMFSSWEYYEIRNMLKKYCYSRFTCFHILSRNFFGVPILGCVPGSYSCHFWGCCHFCLILNYWNSEMKLGRYFERLGRYWK